MNRRASRLKLKSMLNSISQKFDLSEVIENDSVLKKRLLKEMNEIERLKRK